MKEFADNNLKFDVNGKKVPQTVENTVGKGEIVCFKRLFLQTRKNQGLFKKGLKQGLFLTHQ